MDKYCESIAEKVIYAVREDSFWNYFWTLVVIAVFVTIVLLSCALSVEQNDGVTREDNIKRYQKRVVSVLKHTWCIPVIILYLFWTNFSFCTVSTSSFVENTVIKYDGIYKRNFQPDRVYDQEYVRKQRDLEGNYTIYCTDCDSGKAFTFFIPASSFYNTIEFEQKMVDILNSKEYLFVNLKVTPDYDQLAILNEPAKKEIQNAGHILFLIGTKGELLYSEDEPIGEYLTQYVKEGVSENIINYEYNEVRKHFINNITLDFINDNWGGQVVLVFDDGLSESITLDSTIKYIQGDSNYVAFNNFGAPIALHFKDETISNDVNININNEIKITKENGGEFYE